QLTPEERDLKYRIDAALVESIIKDVLFAPGSRDFESLRLGFLWIRPTPLASRDDYTAAAVIRILLGRSRRWSGSDKEGRLEPPQVVKQYLESVASVNGEPVIDLTGRIETVLRPCLSQWLVNPRVLFVLGPRPDAEGRIEVYACDRCGRTHLHS